MINSAVLDSEGRSALCGACGAKFIKKRDWHIYCSNKCRGKRWKADKFHAPRTGTYTDVRNDIAAIKADVAAITKIISDVWSVAIKAKAERWDAEIKALDNSAPAGAAKQALKKEKEGGENERTESAKVGHHPGPPISHRIQAWNKGGIMKTEKAICVGCLKVRNLTHGNPSPCKACGSRAIVWVFSTVEQCRTRIITEPPHDRP